jgi:hypothetical protein
MSRRVTIFGSSFASAPAFPYLLDLFPNAVKAHSFQLLRSAYAGDVQTARGNTTGDVPFAGNFQDNTELLNIVGAGNGFMPLWYDQSTAAADSTQPTALRQPRVVNGGVIENVNGYPAARFDGTDDFMIADDLVTHIGGNNAPFTVSAVIQWLGAGTGRVVFSIAETTQTNRSFFSLSVNAIGQIESVKRWNTASNQTIVQSTNSVSSTLPSVATLDFDGATIRIYINGVFQGSGAAVGNWFRPITNGVIGARKASTSIPDSYYGSQLLELTVWPFSQFAAGNIAGVNDNIKSRYGIT